ncbi:MAG TPA: hypothetical protein VH196_06065, partial [Terriglobales bacterium]|nr:hypothetical protein [Terriglobales bacterium]
MSVITGGEYRPDHLIRLSFLNPAKLLSGLLSIQFTQRDAGYQLTFDMAFDALRQEFSQIGASLPLPWLCAESI